MMYSTRLVLVAVVVTGCTGPQDITAVYPHPAEANGAIDVSLTTADGNMTVTVDDSVVVDRKFSRKAHIDGVPAGPARVHVALGGNCVKARDYTRDVDIEPGQTAQIALPGAEINDGCAILDGLLIVADTIELVALGALAMFFATGGGGHATTHN
jgi:hypothetical protein